jgi:hypothetical protein
MFFFQFFAIFDDIYRFIKMIPATPTSKPTTQTGNTGGSTGATTNTGSTTTTGTGGSSTTTTSEPPAELEVPPLPGTGTCPEGTHGGSTPTTVHCLAQKTPDGSFILPSMPMGGGVDNPHCLVGWSGSADGKTCVQNIPCPLGMTKIGVQQCVPNKLLPATTTTLPAQTGNAGGSTGATSNTGGTTSTPMTTPMKTGGGTTTTTGTGTTTTTTNPNTPATTTTSKTSSTSSPQSSSTVTNVITNNKNVLRGSSSTTGGAVVATSPSQTANNNNKNFLTYVNTPDKITIRYPSTWTKTEFADNPSIPVIFNAPINGSIAAKTTLMININQLTPSSATPDGYTQQQINALTNSSVIKYTITDTNAKALTPPTGVAAYREISYNGIKNSIVNNISTQIPLKGTAIFFVNGDTGYSLLYLAKQTEYNQNLPMVQQMINTFQINAAGGGVGSGAH